MKTRKVTESLFLTFILFKTTCTHLNSLHFLNTNKMPFLLTEAEIVQLKA